MEYKAVEIKRPSFVNSEIVEEAINQMAKDGWELVTTISPSNFGTTLKIILVFKKGK